MPAAMVGSRSTAARVMRGATSLTTLRLTRQQHFEGVAEFARVWQRAATEVNATIVDPSEVLCPSNECIYRTGLVSLYIDAGHLGAEGVLSMQPLLLKALQGHVTAERVSSP